MGKKIEAKRERKPARQRTEKPTGIEALLVELLEEQRRQTDALENLADSFEELVEAAVYQVDKDTSIVGVSVNKSSSVFGEDSEGDEPDPDSDDEPEEEEEQE
jgi:hypothetical protein